MSVIGSYRRSFQTPLFDKILKTTQAGANTPRAGTAAPPPNGAAPPGGFPGRPGAFFNSQPSSGFYDGNGKYLWKVSPDQTLTVSYYTGSDKVDNSRTLQLPTDFLQRLKDRGVDLAARGIDTSNPNLSITDLREKRDTGVGVEWAARVNSRVAASVSAGGSLFEDLRDRSFQAGNSTNPAAEDNRMQDLNLRGRHLRDRWGQKHIRNRHRVHSERLPIVSSSPRHLHRPTLGGQSTTPLAQVPERRKAEGQINAGRAGTDRFWAVTSCSIPEYV